MMKYTIVLFLAFGAFFSHAQKILVPGKVIDSETKEPLPFASIGIKGKTIGTITNLQGEFDFHLPAEMRNDILMINMLGYKTFEAPVWSMLDNAVAKPIIIELIKSPVILNEVTIKDSLRAGDIMQIAISRIDQNYPVQPFLLDGFYRDVKKLGGTYISLLEAAVKIYDEDYREPRNKFKLRERVALEAVRRSLGYDNKFTSFFDRDNLLEDLLLNNNVRYRLFPEEEHFFNVLERDKDSYFEGNDIYVIVYNKDYKLRVYVEKKTYGIVYLEYENYPGDAVGKKRDLESKYVRDQRIINFKSINGKLYLNFIQMTSQVNWYEKNTGKLKFETELQRQLLINNVETNPEKRIPVSRKMKSYGLQFQDESYNKEFWENYNVIKETPLNKKIVEDLERKNSLESQFKDNN
jgi:hypothetical protein